MADPAIPSVDRRAHGTMRSGPRHLALLVLLAAAVAAGGCGDASDVAGPAPSAVAPPAPSALADPETLYQVSTLSALIDGLYQPAVTVAELKKLGDIGIGTFEALDGEMVELDGTVYQVKADGTVTRPPDKTGSPFAAVTMFGADKVFDITAMDGYEALKKELDTRLGGVNEIRVLRIEGRFDYVRTRSVPRQSEPYKPLLEVTAEQPEFEFRDAEGVLVGVWCPAWVGQINLPGYHLHFLTADRRGGGHVLDVKVARATAQIDDTPGFNLTLPTTREFRQSDLAGEYDKQMKAAEQ